MSISRQELTENIHAHVERQGWNSPFDSEAHAAIMRILHHHPRGAEKEGVGVAFFFKTPNANGFPVVHIRRLDLSLDDFDWRKAILWATRTDKARWLYYQDSYSALRQEIEPQIEDYRNALRKISIAAGRAGYFRSDLSSDWLVEKDCQIDHVYPVTFSMLVATFAGIEKIDLRSLETTSTYPQPGRLLADRDLAERWKIFHRRNARLRILSKQENIKESSKSPRLTDLLESSCSIVN